MSSRAWVGCSSAASPALITLASSRLREELGRPPILAKDNDIGVKRFEILAVSLSVSPLVRLELVAEMLMTSALRRKRRARTISCPRARLDKKVDQRLSAQGRHFFDLAVPTSLKAPRCLETGVISSAVKSRRPSKSLWVQRYHDVAFVPMQNAQSSRLGSRHVS